MSPSPQLIEDSGFSQFGVKLKNLQVKTKPWVMCIYNIAMEWRIRAWVSHHQAGGGGAEAVIELVSLALPVDPHGTYEIVTYEWVSTERK